MIDLGKFKILGVQIDAVDYESAIAKVTHAAHNQQSLSVTALAVHGVMTGVLDRVHRHRLNMFEMVVPDGQPVRWALNLLYRVNLPDRVYGPTLMVKVCKQAVEENLAIYLYGSRIEVLDALEKNLVSQFPGIRIAGSQPSRFRQLAQEEKNKIINSICMSGAQVVFVGLGCPRQEVWIYEHRKLLPMPCIAVGAAFDIHAGMLRQAPPIMQKYGLEWLFRLIQEPRRLWKRYMFLNPAYIFLILLQMLGVINLASENLPAPPTDLNYG